ncbi:hypothetical protein [Filimonas effusa]|uniref:Uncharacterized protein n=1 Tax=Filimonas effusa TaxID=2508721 RepID=A0A4Q1D5S6_9BACT|nr:hypothetical protein [Filimonas effusa]RXK83326.1 hypothetical protein ESB13_14570 [Filimonas effusa]
MSSSYPSLIPEHYTGEETETSSRYHAEEREQSTAVFREAFRRLKQVNKWKEWSGSLSSSFELIDKTGSPVNGEAEVGLYIRIDIPGPGNNAGDGYDWVYIEKLEYIGVNDDEEWAVMIARPAEPPGKDETAHFLTDRATSSFVIHRDTLEVKATVLGRNEIPNTESSGIVDIVRNAIVGSSGAIGVSKLQWKALTAGLLETT